MVRSRGVMAALTAVQSVDPHHLRRPRVSTASRGLEPASTNSDHGAPGTPCSLLSPRRYPVTPAPFLYRLFVGSDVAAATFAVSFLRPNAQPARAFTSKQTPTGFADLHSRLLATEPDPHAVLNVLEATGTYWMRLARFLTD